MASARTPTDSLRGIPDSICVSFLPDSEKISHTVIDRGINKYYSCYLDDIRIYEQEDSTVEVTAQCFRSMRKNEPPHRLSFHLDAAKQKINHPHCSCKAGLSGHCSHVIGLVKTLQSFKLNNFSNIPDKLSCTSLPQAWGAASGRGLKIQPVPINHIVLAKPVENRKRRPPSCKIDTEKKVIKVAASEIASLKAAMAGTPLEYLLTPDAPLTATVIGEVQVGSAISYQMRNLKTNPPNPSQQQCGNTSVNRVSPISLPQEFQDLGQTLTCLDPAQLEESTRSQSECREWREARKERLTASNFHRVLARKAKVTDKFLDSMLCTTTFSAPAVDYGKRNEVKAKAKYLETFPDRHLHKCGLVVNNEFPFLGASPDGKVCDAGQTGIVEIKCPYTSRNSTIKEACGLPDFCLEEREGTIRLKRSHAYYTQVQGQLMVTGCDFCYFVVFTQRDFHVERVFPDIVFMSNLLPVLAGFYRDHAKPYLATLHKGLTCALEKD